DGPARTRCGVQAGLRLADIQSGRCNPRCDSLSKVSACCIAI
ncbi:MAG: hypothetical protein AVDCRST_MAG51-2440, partial [uncultured Ramlibacter sp.]